MSHDPPTIDDAVGPLLDTLREGPDPTIRAFSALTLAQCNRPAVIPALVAALADPQKVVRGAAARALAGLGAEAVPALIASLGAPSWVVRYRAAEALGRIPDPRVTPALVALLEDEKDHVRYMAAKGLGADPAPAAIDPLLNRLDDENPFVRRMAAQALASAAAQVDCADAARIQSALGTVD